jgi:uncharacterized protein
VKLIDLNLFIYAFDSTAVPHRPARKWIEEVLSGSEPVALTWPVLLGFIRLSTNARVFSKPLDVSEAMGVVNGWLDQPCTVVVHPTERHADVLGRLLAAVGVARNLTSDAHLAALAIEHNAQMCSSDADFGRFPGVRWVDPLAG